MFRRLLSVCLMFFRTDRKQPFCRRLFLSVLLLLGLMVSLSAAGRRDSLRIHATLVGVGAINQLDTYMSPLEYTGTSLHFLQDNSRRASLLHRRLTLHHQVQATFSKTSSPGDHAHYWGAIAHWTVAARWRSVVSSRFYWEAGPQWGLHTGCLYHTRGGNNLAQGRLSTDLRLSSLASWSFPLSRRTATLCFQTDVQLIGLQFSPRYGESYYEMFELGHGGFHNVCVTSPFSAISSWHLLSLEIPFRTVSWRVGVAAGVTQSHVNHLKTHDWTTTFLIGCVRRFALIPSRL